MTNENTTSAAVDSIIEAARAGQPVEQLFLGSIYSRQRADGGVDVIDLTTAEHIARMQELTKLDPEEGPARKTGTVVLTEAASFTRYVNDHSESLSTTVYGDRRRGQLVAVLNGHARTISEPGWGDHRAVLDLTVTDAWRAWTQMSGTLVGQAELAEFLEDRAGDVVEPDAATLIEITTTMQAYTSVAWKSGVRLRDGTVQLGYEETSEATAGTRGQLAIPQSIKLGLQPYEGGSAYPVTARLRYRMRDGKLTIGVVLDRPDDVLRAAFESVVEVVEAATDMVVLHGRPAG